MHPEDFSRREPFTQTGPHVEKLQTGLAYLLIAWALVLVTGALINYGYNHATGIGAFLQERLSPSWSKAVVFTSAVTAAGGMFWLRMRWRTLYGAIEIGFALVSIWRAAGEVLADARYWPAMAAAAYIFVRGLDNWRQGRSAIGVHVTQAP